MEKVNGWSNLDTWRAVVWLDNDINMYSNWMNILKMPEGRIMSLRALLRVGIQKKIITDEINLDNVNYDEIIDNHIK